MECCTIPIYSGDDVAGFAIVDEGDYHHLNQWRWTISDNGYARRRIYVGDREFVIYMHRVVLGLPDDCGLQGDHINGSRLDNRRANLRAATIEQNAQNRFAQDGKLGGVKFKGVYAHRNSKTTFSVRIRVNGKTLYLGSFKSQIEAALVYDAAARQHFGPRAKLNFPTDGTPPASSREITTDTAHSCALVAPKDAA